MVCGGGERYVTNVCVCAALFCLYSGIIITQTAHRRESVPLVFDRKLCFAQVMLSAAKITSYSNNFVLGRKETVSCKKACSRG